MNYKYITQEEARTLVELGSVVYNRYRNADRDSVWNKGWLGWMEITGWGPEDWLALDTNQWEDEFLVEVE